MKIASIGIEKWGPENNTRLSLKLDDLSSKEMEALAVLKNNNGGNIIISLGVDRALLMFYSDN